MLAAILVAAARRLVEMQMVGVGLVIIGRQGRRKQRAGAIAHFLEEAGPLVVRIPMAGNRDGAPVGEAEGGDVDRIGGRMFAEIAGLPAADAAAAVAAKGGDCLDRGAEMAGGGGVDDLFFPQDQADRHRAAGLRGWVVGDGLRLVAGEGDAVVIAAIRASGDRRQGRIADARFFEQLVAARGLVGEGGDLAGGERANRRGQRQRRPGHAAVVRDPFIAAQEEGQRNDQEDQPHQRARSGGAGWWRGRGLADAGKGGGFRLSLRFGGLVVLTGGGGESSPGALFAGRERQGGLTRRREDAKRFTSLYSNRQCSAAAKP